MSKDAFHFAKLSLFNVRLLDDLQSSNLKGVQRLIESRAKADNVCLPVSLLHQGTFLAFAYICLVWLWERLKAAGNEACIAKKVGKHFNFSQMCKVDGERKVEKPEHYLRLIRNAISHAKVCVTDKSFEFRDRDERGGEKDDTVLEMTWESLGELSEAVLSAVNRSLYP
jgi:hypothetical protein